MSGLFFNSSPSFSDFVVAAGQIGHKDSLRLNDDGIFEKCQIKEEESLANQSIWKAFSKAVRREFTPEFCKAVSLRYGKIYDEKENKHPFQRRAVEIFGVAAASPYTYQLKEQLRWYQSLRRCSPDKIHRLYLKAKKNEYLGTVEDPTDLHGGMRRIHEQFSEDYFHIDQARTNLFRGIEHLVSEDPNIPRLHPYYQRLVMGIICLLETNPYNATKELVIPAPGEKRGTVEYYRVHKIISNSGLNAVALVPISDESKLEPLLCFRCTKQRLNHHGSFESNLENLNKHIGVSSYKACQEALTDLLEDQEFNRGRKVTVLSYSQGGGHAAYFMRDHWDKIKSYIGFNTVGSDSSLIKEIAEKINSLKSHEVPPQFYHHRNVGNEEGTEGDWANKIGQRHLGHGINHPNARVAVFDWCIFDYQSPTNDIWDLNEIIKWLDVHGVRPMDTNREDVLKASLNKKWKYPYRMHAGPSNADAKLDTYNRDPTLEDLRRGIGYKFIYNLATSIFSWADFFLRLLKR